MLALFAAEAQRVDHDAGRGSLVYDSPNRFDERGLDAAGLDPKYRLAVYKERLGVRKGKDAYLLMEK